MKIDIRLPQQDVEANVKCYDANGKEVKVSRIVVEPIFHDAKQRVPVLYATTSVPGNTAPQGEEPKDEEIQRFMLTIGGTNGKTTLMDRSKRVEPQFMANRKKQASQTKDKEPSAAKGSPEKEKLPQDQSIPGEIELPDSQPTAKAK